MISKIPFNDLIKDLETFYTGMDKQLLGNKAQRVITKCYRQGHIKLAERLEDKYRGLLPKFDIVMALQFSLLVNQKQKLCLK